MQQVTFGPSHHFFGFHDLPITDALGKYFLSLSTDDLREIPDGEISAQVNVHAVDDLNCARSVGETRCFNYPQGARQQWVGGSVLVSFNTSDSSGKCFSQLIDVETGKLERKFEFPIYCIDALGVNSYSFDFARAHRLGGYGYPSISECFSGQDNDNGVVKMNLQTGRAEVIVPLRELQSLTTTDIPVTRQYVTHIRLCPLGRHLAFLHRLLLKDGGLETRLITADIDGGQLSLVACGTLSHFDWVANDKIVIWGRLKSSVDNLRSGVIQRFPIPRPLLLVAKRIVRGVSRQSIGTASEKFMLIDIHGNNAITDFFSSELLIDGHPMINPSTPNLMCLDSYPDENEYRQLYLIDILNSQLHKILDAKKFPLSPRRKEIEYAKDHVKKHLDLTFSPEQFAFTRSGMHCDLHPRWSANGKSIYFDHIKEGERQIFKVDI